MLLCKHIVSEDKLSIFRENGSHLTWEHLFMETRQRRWLFPEQHLCRTSIHPLFSLWWLKKKKKELLQEKSLQKLPTESDLVKTTATSVILSLVDIRGDCPETCPMLWARQTSGQIPASTVLIQAKFLKLSGPRRSHVTHSFTKFQLVSAYSVQFWLSAVICKLLGLYMRMGGEEVWRWGIGEEREHRVVFTALILMQTLIQHSAFINCTHSPAKKSKWKALGWPWGLMNRCTISGQTPWVQILALPPMGSLILGKLYSFPGLYFLLCKLRVLTTILPIS